MRLDFEHLLQTGTARSHETLRSKDDISIAWYKSIYELSSYPCMSSSPLLQPLLQSFLRAELGAGVDVHLLGKRCEEIATHPMRNQGYEGMSSKPLKRLGTKQRQLLPEA